MHIYAVVSPSLLNREGAATAHFIYRPQDTACITMEQRIDSRHGRRLPWCHSVGPPVQGIAHTAKSKYADAASIRHFPRKTTAGDRLRKYLIISPVVIVIVPEIHKEPV